MTNQTPSEAYLQIRDLRVAYGSTVAVDGVDLAIEQGQTLALLGPSGCGKTTILRAIAGLVHPDGGSVRLGGQDLLPVPIHRRDIGLVFQTWALFPHMSVADNVAYGLRMRQTPKAERSARVREALELVQLGHLGERRPSQLSGGQQQRVALARAIVTRPRLLLLDEPLSSLDLKIRIELRRELRRIQRTLKLTSVFVTHDHSEALALGDRVAVMSVGRVVEAGPPEQLFGSPRTAYVTDFLGFDNILPASAAKVKATTVEVEVAGRRVVAARPESVNDAPEYRSVALSPWVVTPTLDVLAGEPGGAVVSLDQQSGRILVSVQTERHGILNGFATPEFVPAIGTHVGLRIDWSRSRALEA